MRAWLLWFIARDRGGPKKKFQLEKKDVCVFFFFAKRAMWYDAMAAGVFLGGKVVELR